MGSIGSNKPLRWCIVYSVKLIGRWWYEELMTDWSNIYRFPIYYIYTLYPSVYTAFHTHTQSRTKIYFSTYFGSPVRIIYLTSPYYHLQVLKPSEFAYTWIVQCELWISTVNGKYTGVWRLRPWFHFYCASSSIGFNIEYIVFQII